MLRLFAFFIFTLVACASAVELHQRQLSKHLLLTAEPLDEAAIMLTGGHLDEAELLARLAADTAHSDVERRAASSMTTRIEAARTLEQKMSAFAMGALTGEPRDLPGFFGSLSLDLFVVGDIRDLAVQGYRETVNGDGDKLIMALSAVGLATTLSPSLDFAPALLKLLRRTGALGERFVKSVTKVSRAAFYSGDYRRLGKIASDFGRGTRALGPAPMARVMKHVDDATELADLSRLAENHAAAVYGLTHLTGGRAVKTFARTTDAGVVARAARRGSRIGKTFAKAVALLPDRLLALVMIAAGLAAARLLASLLPRPRRRARRIPVLTERVQGDTAARL